MTQISHPALPVTADQLGDALLRHHHELSRTSAAAVGLVVWHGTWIERLARVISDEDAAGVWPGLRACVTLTNGDDGALDAYLHVAALHAFVERGDMAYSRTERALVALAASLAQGVPVDLQEAVTGLGPVNAAAVMYAVATAAGHEDMYGTLVEDAQASFRDALPDWLAQETGPDTTA
ncbi:hypothetical protein [Streptomyces alboflavus]|uniref:hypothetical protein n=1 Tax=Streptomyces alboflavus TaxID=67267 RepID=UPI00367D8BAA